MKPRLLFIETGGTIAQLPAQRTVRNGHGMHRMTILKPPRGKPRSIVKQVKGISSIARYEVEVFKAIDSTDMLTADRIRVAKLIYQNARDFDGFVVVHGTDTMADTASALTFMIQRLGKPIVLTGSQIPLYKPRTEGRNNVLAAAEVATQDFGEVVIAFGEEVVRGPCAIKEDEQAPTAFKSPRVPPIGKIGIDIVPAEHRIRRFQGDPIPFTDFDTNIAFFYPASGADVNTFTSQVENPEVHGVVVVGFGAGNVPKTYHSAISRATGLHKPVMVVTECLKGQAEMVYEAGAIPIELGAISGCDMTMKCAVQKLMYALGRAATGGIEPEKHIGFIKDIMHTIYAKELSVLPKDHEG